MKQKCDTCFSLLFFFFFLFFFSCSSSLSLIVEFIQFLYYFWLFLQFKKKKKIPLELWSVHVLSLSPLTVQSIYLLSFVFFISLFFIVCFYKSDEKFVGSPRKKWLLFLRVKDSLRNNIEVWCIETGYKYMNKNVILFLVWSRTFQHLGVYSQNFEVLYLFLKFCWSTNQQTFILAEEFLFFSNCF